MWIDINEIHPPVDELVLVYQQVTGRCLRYRVVVDEPGLSWYDENHNYDDSGLEVAHWLPLAEEP